MHSHALPVTAAIQTLVLWVSFSRTCSLVVSVVRWLSPMTEIDAWDLNGNGKIDGYDTTGDGNVDAWDTTGDGFIDAIDSTGDGRMDTEVDKLDDQLVRASASRESDGSARNEGSRPDNPDMD